MGTAQHRPLTLVALLDPLPIPLDRTPVTFAGSREKHLQGRFGVGYRGEVSGEDPADLSGLDVDVHETALAPVGGEVPGVAGGPAVADADDQICLQEGCVGVAVGGLDSSHSLGEGVVVRDRAPSHQRRDHRNP